MKKCLSFIFVLVALSTFSFAQVDIIPKPNKLEQIDGSFLLTGKTKIIGEDEPANYLQKILQSEFKINLKTAAKKPLFGRSNTITLQLDSQFENNESYQLISSKKGITISASSNTGLFYGIQTLRQLIDKESIPYVKIEDKPRFSWRAYMLDESRHFQGEEFVKMMLDQMALLKMNVFHWHLTDDAGWRIEIKKYPKLTEIGSKRKDTQIGGWNSEKRSGKPHSGFYTQEQIKRIVKYARDRHITIVPEIEMPGHSSAAIAAYPWLGTSGEKIEVPVIFGKKFDTYNVADPRVIQFLEDVLVEVMDLFPSEVIHIGGDEVKFDAWKQSKDMQHFMQEKGLESPKDVQIYFTNNISNFLESKKRRMMGWNEIFGGAVHEWQKSEDFNTKQSLAKNTVVHFWKGDIELAKQVVEKGYDIVNSHHVNTYLDYGYKYIPLKKAYNFDPIPKGLDQKYHSQILGSGCQMWTEWAQNNDRVEYQSFPRIAAYAEVGWTEVENKNYDDFSKALENFIQRWKKLGIDVAPKADYGQ